MQNPVAHYIRPFLPRRFQTLRVPIACGCYGSRARPQPRSSSTIRQIRKLTQHPANRLRRHRRGEQMTLSPASRRSRGQSDRNPSRVIDRGPAARRSRLILCRAAYARRRSHSRPVYRVPGTLMWTIGRLLGSQHSFAERFIANGLGWDSPCRYFSGIRAALYERPACASTRRDDQEPLLLAAVPA